MINTYIDTLDVIIKQLGNTQGTALHIMKPLLFGALSVVLTGGTGKLGT